jgi:deoxycytidylate deaminase
VSDGKNGYRMKHTHCNRTIHAEEDAIRKLPFRKNKKKIEIDLLVIRINKNGKLLNSKPCSNCLKKMKNIKGYKIKYVHYSTENGTIVTQKLSDLLQDTNVHISYFFNKNNR